MTLFFVDTIFYLIFGRGGRERLLLAWRNVGVQCESNATQESKTKTTNTTTTTASGNTQKEGYGYNTRCERAHLHSGTRPVEGLVGSVGLKHEENWGGLSMTRATKGDEVMIWG